MIKFLKKVWAWVRTDGLLHILVSNLIALYLSGFIPLWIALLVAFLIGVGYEVYQKLSKKGCAEWHDIICDAGGGTPCGCGVWHLGIVSPDNRIRRAE